MERINWTEEMEQTVIDGIRAGKSYNEICAEMGIRKSQLQNRVNKLRAADPTIPFAARASADCRQSETNTTEDVGEGAMNELETAMSEVITELRGENDALAGEKKILSDRCSALESELLTIRSKCARDDEEKQLLQDKVKSLAELVERSETELDRERMNADKLREVIKDLRCNRENVNQSGHKDLIIEQLEEERMRLNRLVLALVERYVLGEVANQP